ncbi:hypothetical protein ABPG75_013978 [Micractinium tetrahymenae]
MATGGLCYLAGQVVCEHEVCSTQSSPRGVGNRRSLEEALTALRKGALLLKHGRHGKPKVHFFRLAACDTLLRWRGASGSVKQVRLRNVAEVVAGQTTEVFRRCPLRPSARCFSLRYRDEDGSSRTLDLTCADEQQYELWLMGLCVVAERLRTLGTPVMGAAGAAAPAGRPGGSAAGGSLLAGSAGGVSAGGLASAGAAAGGLSPAELSKCVAGSRARLASGPVAVPVAERTPCDLLAWGSAQRAPPVAPSLRSVLGVTEECWQRRSLPGLVPAGSQLDAYRAAVGRKHAAVITATGALYTWGEGRGGKLGLGHDQDQPLPQRVRHGLEGQVAVAVACGDDCTAALTEGGELFAWGRLHADSPPQLVPLHVRGELRGRKVVQISCGPFHCAAVTADGALFTWGEGFGGKLGHGDQSSRTHPTQVAAFAGRQVLEAACGVWHTAAIVAEPEGTYHQPLAAGLQHSPMRLESIGAADTLAGFDPAAAATTTAVALGIPPASPVHHGSAHHRNNSTSSAFSEASIFQDGQGGCLYTWGGVNESVAFGSSEKHDSNKGCLGHGETDLYRGQLLPVRVGGALESRQVRHVAAGSHLTVAVTSSGRVYQMGATGASGAIKNCPWEGATLPELVRGALQGFFIDEVSCGMHHCVVLGRPADRKTGRPAAEPAPRAVFAWGRGSEGQLGVKGFEDSPAPLQVDALKGRQVLQVTCGGSNSMAVCEHNTSRWEPDSKEEAEAASRALYALTVEPKPPSGKQLRIQAPGEDVLGPLAVGRHESEQQMGRSSGGMGSIVRRSLSVIVRGSGGASVAGGAAAIGGQPSGGLAPPNLARNSSSSVRSAGGASAAGSARGLPPAPSSGANPVVYSLGGGYRSQPQMGRESAGHPPQHPPHRTSMQRVQSNRSGSGALGSSNDYGSVGGAGSGGHRVLSIGSPVKGMGQHGSGSSGFARRATYAGGGSTHGSGMVSARSFTALSGGGAASFGRASDRSSLSSWHHHRAHSDDGRGHEQEADSAGAMLGHSGQHALSSSDLAGGMDDVRSGSSVAALHDELAEKNRIIECLQRKLEKLQLAAQRPASAGRPSASHSSDAEARLRESVELSAGAFRAAQQAAAPAGASSRPAAFGRSSRPATPHGLLSGPSTIPEEDQHTQLAAMEQMLAKKEALLEGQQQKLTAWAAELQRRELLLAQQKARLEGRAGGSGGLAGSSAAAGGLAGGGGRGGSAHSVSFSPVESSPLQPPIPCESPVIVGRPGTAGAAAAASPLLRRGVEEGAVTPPSNGGVSVGPDRDGGGGTPGTPALPGEWQEEFEPGVHLTFTSEGGVTKLKRIRFSRSLFSADSAKQWYEANKHLLAQPSSTPRLAALNGGGLLPTSSGSLGSSSQPGTPHSLPAAGQQAPQAPPAAQAPANAPQQREGGGAGVSASAAVQAGLLHYRQTSRNLSFDARELATFHERLQSLASQHAQQQGGAPAHAAGAASSGLPPMHRPSRLSQMSCKPPPLTPAAEAGAGAAAGTAGAAEPSVPVPKSPFAAPGLQSCRQGQQQQQPLAAEPAGPAESAEPTEGAPAGVEGEASRPFLSAQSSPQSQPLPADGSLTATPRSAAEPAGRDELAAGAELAPVQSASNLASHSLGLDSCASSPIRASGGSRGSSPLSKQRSVASGGLAKQLSSPQSEPGKGAAGQQALLFNPRVADKAAGGASLAERSSSGHSRSSSSMQGSLTEADSLAATSGRPSSASPGGALSRLRRSLTGSAGSKKK